MVCKPATVYITTVKFVFVVELLIGQVNVVKTFFKHFLKIIFHFFLNFDGFVGVVHNVRVVRE